MAGDLKKSIPLSVWMAEVSVRFLQLRERRAVTQVLYSTPQELGVLS